MWMLDPDVTHLNHGSFGATPVRVLEDQDDWRRRLESNPVRFFAEEYHPALADARARLVGFLGGEEAGTAFVANATTGVNAVLSSIPFVPGDEIIITNHEYNACRNAAEAWAQRAGAKVVEVSVPFPPESPKVVVEQIMMAVGPNTRLVIVDHVADRSHLPGRGGRCRPRAGGAGVDRRCPCSRNARSRCGSSRGIVLCRESP